MLVGLLLTSGKDKMQEVTQAVERARTDMQAVPVEETDKLSGPPGEMLAAAEKWAKTSLSVFSGELLRKAMLLAAAMSEFAHEAQNPR